MPTTRQVEHSKGRESLGRFLHGWPQGQSEPTTRQQEGKAFLYELVRSSHICKVRSLFPPVLWGSVLAMCQETPQAGSARTAYISPSRGWFRSGTDVGIEPNRVLARVRSTVERFSLVDRLRKAIHCLLIVRVFHSQTLYGQSVNLITEEVSRIAFCIHDVP